MAEIRIYARTNRLARLTAYATNYDAEATGCVEKNSKGQARRLRELQIMRQIEIR
jgi:hypothetical protein